MKSSSGAQEEKLLYKNEFDKVPLGWSPDAQSILFSAALPKTGIDVGLLSLEGKPIQLLHGDFNETHAQLSPDGEWIAYASDESGGYEVYVQNFPRSGPRKMADFFQQRSSATMEKRWQGAFLYSTKRNDYGSADIKIFESIEAGIPQALFTNPKLISLTSDIRRPAYDVFPDGQQFLFRMPSETGATPISVIINWATLLPK